MKIILSPAKKMKSDPDGMEAISRPEHLQKTREILLWLKTLPYQELKELWKCNDKIAEQNMERLKFMDPDAASTPAILSYEGIAYQYMAPSVFESGHWDYVQKHLRILSAFYGVLRPLDAVTPYRLEMQAEANIFGYRNMYEFWGDLLYKSIAKEDSVIINLASKEYYKCIESYLDKKDLFITCNFGEWSDGKFKQKGTYAKMARGEMVRFMAEHGITDPNDIKKFNRLNYSYSSELSSDKDFYFLRKV